MSAGDDPKPTESDAKRARDFFSGARPEGDVESVLALEFARVRFDERQQLQPACEQAHLEAMEIGAENERKRIVAAICLTAGRFASLEAQREAILQIVRGETEK